jgi:two-component system phosphate regulon sensor histidine kinase PhoR
VSSTSRRITIYWLLLLLPALVVGFGAIQLLRREQARLAEQTAEATEARRAASAARARLIVENVELLVGDVEEGLLDVLAAEPEEDLDGFLARLEKTNPLVRVAFRCSPEGELRRPSAGSPDEDTRGFVRRFAKRFSEEPPWGVADAVKSPAPSPSNYTVVNDDAAVRKEVVSNVAQVQSARRDVQELLKTRDYPHAPAPVAAPPSAPSAASAGTGRSSYAVDEYAARQRQEALRQEETRRAAESEASYRQVQTQAAMDVAPPPAQAATSRSERGWKAWTIDGRLHLVGWVQPPGAADVRGVELEMAALLSRLAGALPAEIGRGEGYALCDEASRIVHQVGLVRPETEPSVEVPLSSVLLPGWSVVGDLVSGPARNDDGAGFFWVSALLVAIFIAAILAGGALLLMQARRSEAEAAQKTSFVANVSHEFKTPLTTIRLYAELLEQGRVRDKAQESNYLNTIARETQRLARLVNNALDFSRLEQGRKKYAREQIELGPELNHLLDTQEPRLAEAGMKLQREFAPGALRLTTDRDALEQIVLNLLDNACKYAATGGEVNVCLAAREAGGAEIRVRDRGPGVPADHRERIFEKFHRVDDALTAEKTGAGLGLSIARQLARGLGGELRYEPRSGGGAEFILELP